MPENGPRNVEDVVVAGDPQRLRAAEEQRHDHAAHRHRVHELGQEEQRESDAGVLGVEPADELLLGLDEVERRPVQLGGRRDQEDHERDERRGWPPATSRCSIWYATMPLVLSVPETRITAARLSPSAAS